MTFMSLLGGLGNKRHVARNRDLTLLLICSRSSANWRPRGTSYTASPLNHSCTHGLKILKVASLISPCLFTHDKAVVIFALSVLPSYLLNINYTYLPRYLGTLLVALLEAGCKTRSDVTVPAAAVQLLDLFVSILCACASSQYSYFYILGRTQGWQTSGHKIVTYIFCNPAF